VGCSGAELRNLPAMSCSDCSRSATGASGKSREAGPETRGRVRRFRAARGSEKGPAWGREQAVLPRAGRRSACAAHCRRGRCCCNPPAAHRHNKTLQANNSHQFFWGLRRDHHKLLLQQKPFARSTTHALAARGLSPPHHALPAKMHTKWGRGEA